MTDNEKPITPPQGPQPPPLPGELVRQPGGGALKWGNPGNRARSAALTREAARLSFDKRLPLLERIADGKPLNRKSKDDPKEEPPITVMERLRAIELLARYGLDTRTQGIGIDDVRDRLGRTLDVIRKICPPELAVALVNEMRMIWKAA